ncbi:efflux RND transporter periplasmic adaptor subunit [Noviherbaspirillum suwonense]|uniref:Membrane fusion protein, multidrug efflux system n=1 Tax=Noviherbaspirillum suwonense TaxID=1224511 RepID=A0ABY1PXH8_9BURK|nr:efflux RND transporter periplasmic adaptor subunit [Noviherbaspirillum suwonense]SMP47649.1 membrane fusion protein, multidrug efflux system [Noviherbaspirillum suwonense]
MDSRVDDTPRTAPAVRTTTRGRFIGAIIALLALAALGWLVWHLTHKAPEGSPGKPGAGAPGPGGPGGGAGPRSAPTTTVGVGTAEQVDLPVTLEAIGTVNAAATVTVRPQVSGVFREILFTEGQMVKAGQVMAVIDPSQFQMALMQATGQRQRDEAQLENARLTLQRYRTLLSQDSIARQDVDTQAALVRQLEGTVVADRAVEGTAKLNLGYSRVVAPISGRVGLRTVDVGNVIGPNDANGIAVITQVSPIDVQFAIPQDRVPEVQQGLGQSSKMTVVALDRTRATVLDEGKFYALDNQVDVQTGTVKAKARFANAKLALFPSQFVNVKMQLRTITGAVVIPVNALRNSSNGDYVYVLNPRERTVAMRKVTRGQASVDKVQIVTGLQPGERVITEGADRLKDGDKVTLPGDRPGAGANGGRRQGAGGEHGGGRRRGEQGGSAAPAGDAAPAGGATPAAPAASSAPASPGAPAAAPASPAGSAPAAR